MSLSFRKTQGLLSIGKADISTADTPPLQVLCYAEDHTGILHPVESDINGHLKISLEDIDTNAIQKTSLRDTSNTNESVSVPSDGTGTSSSVDMNGFSRASFFGISGNLTDSIIIQVSNDNSSWYDSDKSAFPNFSTGHFHATIETSARYLRATQTDTTSTATSITLNISRK